MTLRSLCQGVWPLTARLEPWMVDLLSDSEQVRELIATYGSALNVHNFAPLAANAHELTRVATEHQVPFRVFVARKANKTRGLVDAAMVAGLGMDVASFGELDQCLSAGMSASDLIVSAAVKDDALLRRSLDADVAISLDNADEAAAVVALARQRERPARVAIRLAVVAPEIAPTRFGLRAEMWLALLATPEAARWLVVEGIHFHLNGYEAEDRAEGIRQAAALGRTLVSHGFPIRYVDMGGGVPMSYLEHESQWRLFWEAVGRGSDSSVTWRDDLLGLSDPEAERPSAAVYPAWHRRPRGGWLADVLNAPAVRPAADDRASSYLGAYRTEETIAQLLRDQSLSLHCEPGRAMLDGCGLTLAQVAFRKETSDGIPLIGLQMNRTQVRSAAVDFLVDPIVVRSSASNTPSEPVSGFVVGAYCIEEELLTRRRLVFPHGVSVGDVIAFPNTAGYMMHILESASHQLPLALNLIAHGAGFEVDVLDREGRTAAAPA